MPIPEPEMKAWLSIFEDEMPGAPAPWFGVNIIDVNEDNLAAFEERVAPIGARILQLPGVSRLFRGMSDYGGRKRVLHIVRYDQTIDPDLYAQLFDNDDYQEEWLAYGAILESYRWFRTYEQG